LYFHLNKLLFNRQESRYKVSVLPDCSPFSKSLLPGYVFVEMHPKLSCFQQFNVFVEQY
jgi:hypothetical protein